ncbi:acetyl-CoA carboxylase biotin carboxyl carrier protein subunit [Muricauda sp. DJ-13]|uniref:Acetyl-CoA carboxylase biotin carboxyl carrier protein subunit n=2 Tax=Croceivirga thetidis TaxID=2721623 RepID=A0ABX1GS91_9FLAO|nr:acetyl-CoA carboxylase biotin carboxyl carrier protein subunit [Croceivirga thetidis]NKI32810.1 acetyl-CoA carboxylase biotin carboxyl carrier protein subunit [Croceivirga thetidis]
MEKKHKLKVNGQYEFELTKEQLTDLDLVKTGSASYHLLRNDKSYHVAIDSKNFYSKKYLIRINNSKYEVDISNPLDVLIENMGFVVGEGALIGSIKAPMPGLILEISVSVGQEVKEGDSLLILEAMKMENVITSPRDGFIKEISVTKGSTVEKNHSLITFE